jgi:hypothetical protein
MSPRRGLRVSFQCDVASTDRIRPLSLLEEDDNDVVDEKGLRPPPLILLEVVLENEGSKQLVQQHRSSLRELVMEQRDSFSVMSNHTHNSSLRSILSAGLHNTYNNNSSSKKWTGVKLEHNNHNHNHNSITEMTEDLTEFSYSGDYYSHNRLFADFESDQRTWGSITGYSFDGENGNDDDDDGNDDSSSYEVPQPTKTNSSSSSSSSNHKYDFSSRRSSSTSTSSIKNDNIPSEIEVTPGVFVPLRGSNETWQAIKTGCTISTHCVSCHAKLHVIEDAALVVCQECWMVSPVTQRLGDIQFELDGEDNECNMTIYGVGLGIKGDEVLQWIKEGNSNNEDDDDDDDDVRGDD